jgi:hypothetical protein
VNQIEIPVPPVVVDPDDIGYRNAAFSFGDPANSISCSHFAFLKYSEIKSGAAAFQETRNNIFSSEFDPQLVTWHSWLGYHELRSSDAEPVPDVHLVFEKAFQSEVLSEHSPGHLNIREFVAPVWIVLTGIDVHRFARPPVNVQVRLPVAVEVELAHSDASGDRLFENSRCNRAALPAYLARKPYVDRDQSHSRTSCPEI